MPTLNEILAAKAAQKTKATAPVLVAKNDDIIEPRQADKQPLVGRLAGFTGPGEQIPMSWPETAAGKAWEKARHSLADEIGVLIDADGKGWIALFRQGTEPIYLHGPLPSIIAPF